MADNNLEQRIQNLVALTGTILGRAGTLSRLGQQYGGDRDIYQALGYPLVLHYKDYISQYSRQDMAKAIIDRPVDATWQGDLYLMESDDSEETAFEKAWKDLVNRLSLKSKFKRLDRLSGLGSYGVMLLGFSDVKRNQDFMNPVAPGANNLKLLYVKPLGEKSALINEWNQDPNNERYGLPENYKISLINPSHTGAAQELLVHHSRVIHVPGQLMESEVEGTPKLKAIFNRLKDLEKLVGGSAEMFWRGARPGYQGKVDPNYQMDDQTKQGLQEQVDEFENNLRRILVNEGVDLQSLAQQVADPKGHVDVQIQMISAVTGIPQRILTGSERGELASSEDRSNWFDLIESRRLEETEPKILRPFVDTCIKHGILPTPQEEYTVQWTDLRAKSDEEKANIGKTRAEALKSYGANPSNMDILPPDAFYKYCLGLDDEDVELIDTMRDASISEEEQDMAGIEGEGEE